MNSAFPGDPTFDDCKTNTCRNAWALRVIDSSNIYIHGAGAYSFFQNYDQTCVGSFDCQERLIQVRGSDKVVIFNIFTVGAVQAATGVAQSFVPQKGTQRYVLVLWFSCTGLEREAPLAQTDTVCRQRFHHRSERLGPTPW